MVSSDRVATLVDTEIKDEGGFCSEHYTAQLKFEYIPNNLAKEFAKRSALGNSFTANEIWTIIYDTVDKFYLARIVKNTFAKKHSSSQY